tara:strand:+ start:1885 stop:2142 length:258 start_codon:yes stop_codon:yes gene_type:complete
MPSLDFIYDITEKLDKEEIEYLVLTIQQGVKQDKVDVFFKISGESEEVFETSIDRIKEIVSTRDDDEKSTPVKPRKRRRKRKKNE